LLSQINTVVTRGKESMAATNSTLDFNGDQVINVSFQSAIHKMQLAEYDAYVAYGSERKVIRCTNAGNGSIMCYGASLVSAFTGKGRQSAFEILCDVSDGEKRLKHNGVDLIMQPKQVVYINRLPYFSQLTLLHTRRN
jgi:hypothetical protein